MSTEAAKLGTENEDLRDYKENANMLAAQIEHTATQAYNNPSQFLAQQGQGNEHHNLVSDLGSVAVGAHAATTAMSVNAELSKKPASSMFIMGGGGSGSQKKSKATSRFMSLASTSDAMGLPKSYSDMKKDAKTLARYRAGRVGKAIKNDPFAQGEVAEAVALSRQSMQFSPRNIKAHPEMARLLGAGELVDALSESNRRENAPSATATIMGAMQGSEKHEQQLNNVDAAKKQEFVSQNADLSREMKMKLLNVPGGMA